MNRMPVIGITCDPSQGGSGVVASELGLSLARFGHEVHFITSDLPLRLRSYESNIFFHRVETASYPLFQHSPYTLALATKMLEITRRFGLDILHVHYAIPHAASAFLAREMAGAAAPKVVTTLHGTDITLVGREPSYFEMTKFMIERSDRVTAVSRWLADETRDVFDVDCPLDVIPNFVDPKVFRPLPRDLRTRLAPNDETLLLHISNFRPVKNLPAVIDVFAGVAAVMDARLLLVGEGPELAPTVDRIRGLGLEGKVDLLGQVEDLAPLMSNSDLLLLPSRHESFGLVALEAMACGTPVIATSVGGAGEFIAHEQTSFLHDPDDIPGMIESARKLLSDPVFAGQMAEDALRVAVSEFGLPCVVKRYIDLYDRILDE